MLFAAAVHGASRHFVGTAESASVALRVQEEMWNDP
jgi:hypothetical protein